MGLSFLTAGTAVVSGAYLATLFGGAAPEWAVWAIPVGIGLLLFGFFDLGGSPRAEVASETRLKLRLVFAATAVWVAAGLALLIAMPAAEATDPALILGLPPRAAWMIYGVGLAPGLFLPLAYALFFDEATLSERSLDHLREVAKRVAAENGKDGGARGGGARDSGAANTPDAR